MMTRRLSLRRSNRPVFVVALAGVLCAAVPAAAQDNAPRPLSKSELVRIVVSNAYSGGEKAALIRGACLSFKPSAGDWSDIEALGAQPEVLEAIRGCSDDAVAAPAPARAQGLAIDLASTRVTTVAGDTATVVATLTRSGAAVGNVSVSLAQASGTGRPITRQTGADGRVVFRVPAGPRSGQVRFRLTADAGALTGPTSFVLDIRAAAPASASASPDSIRLPPDSVPLLVAVTVSDRFDNAVGGAEVSLKTDSSGAGLLIGTATSGADGVARFELDSAVVQALAAGDLRQEWTVEFAGRPLTTVLVDIAVDTDAAAEAAALAALEVPAPGAGGTEAFNAEMRAGRDLLSAGDADSAAVRFRAAVRLDPRSEEAKKGLASAALASGDAEDAAFWYRIVTTDDPEDVEAWLGLGTALAEAGRQDESRQAFARAVQLDPDGEIEANTGGSSSSKPPMFLGASVWGGSTFQTDGSGGIREATVRFDPSSSVGLWGSYDDGLYRTEPWLVRGKDVIQAIGGGASVGWNNDQMHTTFSVRARDQGFGLQQNLFQLEQRAALASSDAAPELRAGGYLGRWYDGDDWLIYAQVGFGVSREVRLAPGFSTGKTYGSNLTETGRHRDGDTRFYLSADWTKPGGLRVTPTLGVGNVGSDVESLSGTLFDLLVDAVIPLGSTASALVFVHHQSPPGSEAFTTLAAGVSLGIDLNR